MSEIGLGSWLTYSGGVEADATAACTRAAFDAGITFFDTANVYGRGAAESAWGAILAEYPRDEYVLATKLFFPMSATDRGLHPDQVAKQIDASLTRLRVDHVDLYQCHRFDAEVPVEDSMAALADVVRAGKARYLGFSEWTPAQIRAGRDALPADLRDRLVSSQPQYSMLWRAPEAEVFGTCTELGISQVVWSPLAEGRADRQVPPRRGDPRGLPRGQPGDGRLHQGQAHRRDAERRGAPRPPSPSRPA